MLRVSSCGETGPARQAEGHPASPVCCDQIVAHREAAKATSHVLWRFHSAELKIVHAEGKARGKSPVGGGVSMPKYGVEQVSHIAVKPVPDDLRNCEWWMRYSKYPSSPECCSGSSS